MSSHYRGNLGSLWASDRAIYQREDHSKRVPKEVARFKKTNALPTEHELAQKYHLAPHEAKRLLEAVKRKIKKEERTVREALAAFNSVPSAADSAKETIGAESTQQEAVGSSALAQKIASAIERRTPLAEGSAYLALQSLRERHCDEIREHGEQTAIAEGFVYLVTHPVFDGWVKAGMTIDFEQRLTTYNVADPLSRFTLAAVRWVPNRRLAERLLLERLAETATQSRGEWFLMQLDEATRVFLTG